MAEKLTNVVSLPSPHGGTLVERVLEADPQEFAHLPALELDAQGYADLELIATGVYSPLQGFMGEADYRRVLEEMRLSGGLPWSIPITLAVPRSQAVLYRRRVRLVWNGKTVGLLEVEEQYQPDKRQEALAVYRTANPAHPGVAALLARGEVYLAGGVYLLHLDRGPFPEHHYTPRETRRIFAQRGWKTVVAFQTRNPIHRAHEYLHKVALEQLDGLFLNPLVGATKADDVPASVRMEAYKVLLEHYYPKERVLLGVYPAAMRYAGPREAVLHAISRKNYGCTHFIVGRDHAGVGQYYGPYEAQEIFSAFRPEEIGIQIVKFEHSFYCRACQAIVTPRTCPHDSQHHLVLSGTRVRELLRAGAPLPAEFTRPEVAAVLRSAYQAKAVEHR
ncbi:sulfate adenylyltransferase [Meiothermus taiwanensis]|jgi:sulfate adenylyltransferase|uniref:Sulfate adenylyltransferase n=1 Tax=Meiothermus taiwanensis WR-220 TaxID=1339250 RepID=A0ABM6WK43_9DEIN|nr:sulfate adenylyltransferase [Meiothermus taiwanensis]AWR87412.1 sulfate adenylyltransferase [Meiothermus taiwanensis WR-220]KIQ55949.1 sulfate adenylyltransferase [Meiothermus taiwanensis]KZK15750.1 sulfate adenylyltransferase [Meiothermus taiwanensis]